MFQKIIIILILIFINISCAKKKDEVQIQLQKKVDPYQVYSEGFEAFSKGDYFMLIKNFQKQNLILKL